MASIEAHIGAALDELGRLFQLNVEKAHIERGHGLVACQVLDMLVRQKAKKLSVNISQKATMGQVFHVLERNKKLDQVGFNNPHRVNAARTNLVHGIYDGKSGKNIAKDVIIVHNALVEFLKNNPVHRVFPDGEEAMYVLPSGQDDLSYDPRRVP